jgi:Holliday junction resolvase RusA-like endonuclease
MIPAERPLESITFWVLGEAAPEGSTKSYYIAKAKRTVTTHQNEKELRAWRNRVATEAQRVLETQQWTNDCVSAYTVEVRFILTRPSSVPAHKRLHPIIKPDIDKLVRAINDALTGILFHDDSQVVAIGCSKDYNDEMRPGAYVTVSRYQNSTERPKRRKKKVAEGSPCDDPRED